MNKKEYQYCQYAANLYHDKVEECERLKKMLAQKERECKLLKAQLGYKTARDVAYAREDAELCELFRNRFAV